MNNLKKKIFICNFTKTISSAVLTAIAINIIMTNATKYALIEGLLPFTLAIVIVALIDLYEYRCEREDKISLDELEDRIEKLELQLISFFPFILSPVFGFYFPNHLNLSYLLFRIYIHKNQLRQQ